MTEVLLIILIAIVYVGIGFFIVHDGNCKYPIIIAMAWGVLTIIEVFAEIAEFIKNEVIGGK